MEPKIILEGITPAELVQQLMGAVSAMLADSKPTPPEEDSFMTAAEVQQFYKISRQTLFNWQRAGKLVPHKIGPKKLYFLRTDVLALTEKGRKVGFAQH